MSVPKCGAAVCVLAHIARRIAFKPFNRIGFLGSQVADSGALTTSGSLNSAMATFIRTARRFGTHVDLVIHRSEWAHLLSQPDTDFGRGPGRSMGP